MNRQDLINTLSLANPFLMRQEFIPILTHFCFNTEHVIAYNDVAGIQINFESDLHCAIPGELLLKLLRTMSDETVRIKNDNNELLIHSGKSKLKLPSLPKESFIFSIPKIENDLTHLSIPISIKQGIKKCLEGVSEDPSHPEHTGIKWVVNDNESFIYSTDNKTISSFPCNYSDRKGNVNAVVPEFFCTELVKLIDYFCVEATEFDVYFSDDYIIVKLGDKKECLLFSRLIAQKEKTPFKQIISSLTDGLDLDSMSPPPLDLHPALERSSLLLSSNFSDVVQIELNNKELKMVTESQYGNADDQIEFDEEFESTSFTTKPQLIQRGLKIAPAIKFTPKLIVLKSDDDFLHLISHSNTRI